ncbi:hypothetical protein ACF0H5_015044 [Mactra antiquata]
MYREYLKMNGFVTSKRSKISDKVKLRDKIVEEADADKNSDLNDNKLPIDTLSNSVNKSGFSFNNRKKLVLHFDIRNTVLVADSVTNVSVEQALNSFLTGVVWGREGPEGEWIWYSDQISLTPPTNDVITYYKFLEKKFVKNTADRTALRLATGDFVHSEIGSRFKPYLQQHLDLLKWRHEFDQETHDILTMSGLDGQQYNYIVPALYKCIHYLVETKREFAIVFRTFGLDAPNVIKSLECGLKGNHPGYPKSLDLKINDIIGTVKRSDSEPTVFIELDKDSKQTFVGDRAIYDMLSQKTGISGFRDDVNYWLENSYHHQTAKPHLIDPHDEDVHHIFFDDNFRTFEDDSIVDVRMFETRDAENARSLAKTEVAQFDNICLVQADLIKCIEEENYYVDRIRECESNYNLFLQKYKRFSRSMSLNTMV